MRVVKEKFNIPKDDINPPKKPDLGLSKPEMRAEEALKDSIEKSGKAKIQEGHVDKQIDKQIGKKIGDVERFSGLSPSLNEGG